MAVGGAPSVAAIPRRHTHGSARTSVTVAGTLTSTGALRSPLPAVFRFRREGTEVCTPSVSITNRDPASGAFSVDVPLDDCGALFDGRDVSVTVDVDGITGVVSAQVINPVPYARYADQVGVSDCPVGYERDASATAIILCTRNITLGSVTVRDDMVRVGTGRTAFWVDRYEASVWGNDGVQRGASDAVYPNLADNGQWALGARDSLRAVARAGVTPSRNMNWFQAASLCNAAGKRLMSRREWFAAADDLVRIDPPTALDGATVPGCNTGGTGPRITGGGTGCASSWGVQDMIGNLWEWTDEWYASTGQVTSPAQTTIGGRVNGIRVNDALQPWPTGYGDDGTWNISSTVYNSAEGQIGIPSAARRGGGWNFGSQAGVFALALNYGPSTRSADFGFRCVSPG